MLTQIVVLLCLIALVFLLGRALFFRMKADRPFFYRGMFRIFERKLLREFTGLYDEMARKKLKGQIRYFTTQGKYWRYNDESQNHIEVFEDEHVELHKDLCFPLKDECVLAHIHFQIKDRKHRIQFRAYNGRLWGWSISPKININTLFIRPRILGGSIVNHPWEPMLNIKEQVHVLAEKRISLLGKAIDKATGKRKRAALNMDPLLLQLGNSNTVLPQSYLELITFTDGLRLKGLTVLDSQTVLQHLLQADEFIPLAELPESRVGVMRGDDTGGLFLQSRETGEMTPSHGVFEDLLNSRLFSDQYF